MSLAERSPTGPLAAWTAERDHPGQSLAERGPSGQRCGDPRRLEACQCGGAREKDLERLSMSSCEVEELRALGGGTGAVGGVVTSDHKS